MYDPLEKETEWLTKKEYDYVCHLIHRVREEVYLNNLAYDLRG